MAMVLPCAPVPKTITFLFTVFASILCFPSGLAQRTFKVFLLYLQLVIRIHFPIGHVGQAGNPQVLYGIY
jgi:hypothetical protein